MSESFPVLRAAVVQAAPVLFDRAATVDKIADLTATAAAQDARLVVFPEAFVPAYPRGLGFGAVVGSRSEAGRELFARYWAASVDVPGADTVRMGEIARQHGVVLAVGVIEREPGMGPGTLYCSVLYFGPDGKLLGKHRKLKPTGSERLIWGEGDGSTLTVIDSEWGRIGGLICWENYMPLARAAMYEKGVSFYLAPTADCRDTWQATLCHIATEGRCFVLGCNQYVRRQDYPEDLATSAELMRLPEEVCRGGSAIYSPMGECISGPLYGEEGILFADLDTGAIARARYDFDAVGHYARPDVFRLLVNEGPAAATTWSAPSDTSKSSP